MSVIVKEMRDKKLNKLFTEYKYAFKLVESFLATRYDMSKIKEKSSFTKKICRNCIPSRVIRDYGNSLNDIVYDYDTKSLYCVTRIEVDDLYRCMKEDLIRLRDNLLLEPIKDIFSNHITSRYVDAVYELYREGSPFCAKYTVNKNKPQFAKDANEFDVIRLSFSMVGDRDKTRAYMKENNVMQTVVGPIFDFHAKEYAGFMKSYSAIITNSNYLVVSFCFKEKAEKTIMGEAN